jgi:hypothetical protein
VDEVREYIDCRYLSSHEATWRLFEFDIHYRILAVERLAVHINPSCGELYYLRMLLNVAKGATSCEDLRTISGVLYSTFKDACQAMGLLGDDSEWREALREASMWGSAPQMRQLLVTIVIFCYL